MAESHSHFEKKEELMPECLNVVGMNGIIRRYIGYFSPLKYPNISRYTLFQRDVSELSLELQNKAKGLAEKYIFTAVPLDQFCADVREDPEVLLVPITVTFRNLTFYGNLKQLSIMVLDQTIDSFPEEKDTAFPGLAELCDQLQTEFFPELDFESRQEILSAVFVDEEEMKTIENEQCALLQQALHLIVRDKIDQGVQLVENYMERKKPEVITNNKYYLELLLLLALATNLYQRYTQHLGKIWIGDQADAFRIKLIGHIQKNLPPRIQQLLMSGVSQILQGNRIASRIDQNELHKSMQELTSTIFYDEHGHTDYRARLSAYDGSHFRLLYLRLKNAAIELCRLEALPQEQNVVTKQIVYKF